MNPAVPGPPGAPGAAVSGAGGGARGQPGLADPAQAGDRDQAGGGQGGAQPGRGALAPDERGGVHRYPGVGAGRLVAQGRQVRAHGVRGRVHPQLFGEDRAAFLVRAHHPGPVPAAVQGADQAAVRVFVQRVARQPGAGRGDRRRVVPGPSGGLGDQVQGAAGVGVDQVAVCAQPLAVLLGQQLPAAEPGQRQRGGQGRAVVPGPQRRRGPVQGGPGLGHVHADARGQPVAARFGHDHRAATAGRFDRLAQSAHHPAQRRRPGRRRVAAPDQFGQPVAGHDRRVHGQGHQDDVRAPAAEPGAGHRAVVADDGGHTDHLYAHD